MTPHKSHGLGTFVIDRRFRGVGRICRASGTADPAVYQAIVRRGTGMLAVLDRTGRQDILERLRDGQLQAIEVYQRFIRSELQLLPAADELIPLSRLTDWAARAATGEDNRASRRLAARYLTDLARADATIGALPGLLRAFRDRCEHTKHRTFNLVRTHVERFLAEQLGRGHRLYLAAAAVQTLPVKPRKGRPMTVAEFTAGVGTMDEAYQAIAWALVLTGMGPKEYWSGRWAEKIDRIEIHGTKRAGRERVVPRVRAIARPTRLYPAFRRACRDAFDGRAPYQLRKTFSRWMEAAKIPRTRRRMYMGHGTHDVTDIYEGYEVAAFLREDARRLRQVLGVAARKARSA